MNSTCDEQLAGTDQSKTENQISSSLLDILLNSEISADESDPLDGFENIGETVIGQLTGIIGMGQEEVKCSLNMFGEANVYPTTNTQKRKNNRRDVQKKEMPISSATVSSNNIESSAKRLHQSDLGSGFSSRSKFGVNGSEFRQYAQPTDEQFQTLHKKLEEERIQQVDDLLRRDVDRLLQAANRIYGPKEWSAEEKTEFASFCRTLRSGKFTEDDKNNLHSFYAKAYQEEYKHLLGKDDTPNEDTVKEMLASRSAICFPLQAGLLRKDSADEKETSPLSSPSVLDNRLDPAMKYEGEKEFRYVANNIFCAVYQSSSAQSNEDPMRQLTYIAEIENLKRRFNEYMGEENKKWEHEDIDQLAKYYDSFKEKGHITIVQSKEIGTFVRKVFGKLEQYEIERENSTELQEKRKYWQEYKKTHVPVKTVPERRSTNTVRPYIKSNVNTLAESQEERRLRKAAYLRQWRLAQKAKKAQLNDFS